MLRQPGHPSAFRLHPSFGKWCAIAVVLVTPGSFVVLPAIWLVRNWHLVKKLEDRLDWGEMREGY